MTKTTRMKSLFGIIIIFSATSSNALTLEEELNNMGKSLYAQAGFYSQCGNSHIIEKNKYVLKWTQYKASQYIALVQSPKSKDKLINEQLKQKKSLKKAFEEDKEILSATDKLNQAGMLWFTNGTKGIVVGDPKISDETFILDFNRKNCETVQKILETNFTFMYNTVF
ncbi:hypothetical protein [Sulfurimonas sp.]|uniref:hypothetical protein n=1 Tax=Sulfurimonas sp. TaxID=2022749 RepID=UPI001A054A13|nr:hypothetical protein [Sulfurimonas sp.]MBE0514410.1 hypothetical protein [Sulfurimonas sp.]